MAKLPSPSDVAGMLFRCRRKWLPDVFPNGRIEGNKFMLGDCYGSAGDSLPIPFDSRERINDFGSDWTGDDLDLFGRGRGHEDNEKAAWLDACAYLGLTEGATAKKNLAVRAPPPERKRSANVHAEQTENIDADYEPPGSPIPNDELATGPSELATNGHSHGRHDVSPGWGQEVGTWTYLTPEGEAWLDEVRFEKGEVKNGKTKKEFHHYLWPAQAWVHGKVTIPRPALIFGLPDITARPGEPVLFVAGAKCAEAATELGYLATTNAGGESFVEHADLRPLAGRTVTIWRDNDPAGEKWQAKLVEGLGKLKPSCTVRVVQLPEDARDGWDVADAAAEMDQASITAILDGAEEPELPDEAYDPIRFIDWEAIADRPPPARQYLIAGMLSVGVVTSLYGVGGAGKSLVSQLLATCAAIGCPFLGKPIDQCTVLLFNAEDDDDELHRRQIDINRYLGITKRQIAGQLLLQGRYGSSNELVIHTRGKPAKATQFLEEIEEKTKRLKGKLVILDNAAQMFSGDEINRAEVTQFLNRLGRLARRHRCAVLLLGHPPKAHGQQQRRQQGDQQQGDDAAYSGSTAWINGVRGLWTLTKGQAGIVNLKIVKANYGATGEEIRLRWAEGVIRLADERPPMTQMDIKFKHHEARNTFLKALDELTAQRVAMSHISTTRNFAPRVITAKGLTNGFTVETLEKAMDELLKDGTIIGGEQLEFRGPDRHWALGIKRTHPRVAT